MRLRIRTTVGARGALACLLFFGVAAGAAAYPLMLDYTGFTWHSGVGGRDRLESVGVLDGFTPAVQVPGEIYTYYLSGLILGSEEDLGGGYRMRTYSGGLFRIYQSTAPADRPYSYGTYPSGGTAPPSFVDGVLWLGGSFGEFSMFLDTVRGIASFSGTGSYTEGQFLPYLSSSDLYTFAGLTRDAAAGVPLGYAHRVDGQLTAAVEPVPEPASILLVAGGLLGIAAIRRRYR